MKRSSIRVALAALFVCSLAAYWLQSQRLTSCFLVDLNGSTAVAGRGSRRSYDNVWPIERIYFINLKKNTQRRRRMEDWLKQQPIPYQRIEALVGSDDDTCPSRMSPARCRGIAGLAKTNLEIIRNRDVSGLTLVFEDDYYVEKKELRYALQASLMLVPDDWDIIRFDCKGPVRSSFPVLVNTSRVVVFRAAHVNPCRDPRKEQGCNFCGSTHAMLWRNSSLPKISALWSKQPYDDIDCRLVTKEINGYCVNMNLGMNHPPEGEVSDITNIPKPKPPNATPTKS
jgi:hypothetical protein